MKGHYLQALADFSIGDQDFHLIIRCMPCDYLGVDSDGKA